MLLKNKQQIGLDVSQQSVHAVITEQKGPTLHYRHLLSTKNNASWLALPNIIYKLREIETDARRLIIGINIADTMTQEITLDSALSESEICDYLQQQATTLFNHHHSDLWLDWERFSQEELQTQQPIRVIAVKKQLFAPILEACKNVRFSLQAIDLNSHAIARLASDLHQNSHDIIGAIHTTQHNACLAIIHNQEIIYLQKNHHALPETLGLNQTVTTSCELIDTFKRKHPNLSVAKLYLSGWENLSDIAEHTYNTGIETAALDFSPIITPGLEVAMSFSMRGLT